jgi:hypothetical protein
MAITFSGGVTVTGGMTLTITAANDPYFMYVPLLLESTSTNAQTNNTFLDSSTNAFTITRNGTVTQGSVTPYWPNGYWSNYFNGSSDYLSVADNTAFNFGTGDATVEFWFSSPSQNTNNYPGIISSVMYNTAGSASIRFDNTGNKGKIFMYINGGGDPVIVSASTVAYGTWNHVAIVRQTTSLKLYLNGSLDATATISGSLGWYFSAGGLRIGRGFDVDGVNAYFLGTVSNIRLVKGVAVYTGAFTVPTSPLAATQSSGTNISAITGTQTSLLTCQSNRFIDNGVANAGSGFTITANSTPKVQAFQPFSPTASYTTAAYGGSGYFNGSSDYLSLASNSAFDCGTGNWTVEGWVYISTRTLNYPAVISNNKGGFTTDALVLTVSNNDTAAYNNKFCLAWGSGGFSSPSAGTASVLVASSTNTNNTWYHFAVVRNGTSIIIYRNGEQIANATVSAGATFNWGVSGCLIGGGNWDGANSYFNGYASNFRLVKGTAVYTAAFTPPTAPVTAITNTSLLLNYTNAGIYDAAVQNNAITVGDAQASTTQSKWSPTSMKFDGTGDWLTAIDGPQLQLGTGDFTIDGWVYLSATGVAYGIISKGAAATGWSVNVTSGNKLQFSYTASNLTGATSLAATTWYYFAVVRSGSATGNLKVYLNGTADATSGGAVTDSFTQTDILYVGASRTGTTPLNGYLQDLRITKGYARTITTPTEAFPTQ